MMTSHLQLFITLSCAFIVYGLEPGILRCDRKRDALFKKVDKDRKLSGHVVATHDVTSSLDCARKCLQTSGCKSYNFQEAGSPYHMCELNNQSKSSVSSSDYVIQKGYSYYDAEQLVLEALPACSSSPCQNGGTCRLAGCNNDYTCDCANDFHGEYCEKWIGLDGSTSARPGHSCLSIKQSGKDKGDGDYWIDPTRSGKPFLVSCDMTTDGGGWTVVHRCELTSSSPKGFIDMPDYRSMRELNWQKRINTDIFKKLRNDMGFNQMRIYCHKKDVKRTVHVKTKKTERGLDVIRFFTENTDKRAAACSSYFTMPDDTSVLSKDCKQLGYNSKGHSYPNQWGYKVTNLLRLYHRVLNRAGGGHSISFTDGNFYCDDQKRDNYKVGDKWILFVR